LNCAYSRRSAIVIIWTAWPVITVSMFLIVSAALVSELLMSRPLPPLFASRIGATLPENMSPA
jgi:hypothetical protein